jgi:hypothetical protein
MRAWHKYNKRRQTRNLGVVNLPANQCSGSMTFWCGSGSADPCLCLVDLDPGSGFCYFRHWPSRCRQKTNFLKKFFLLITFCRYIYIIFQRQKSKRSKKRNQGFAYYFCLLIEGSGSGSTPLWSGSGRSKKMWIRWIRIRNTAANRCSGIVQGCCFSSS